MSLHRKKTNFEDVRGPSRDSCPLPLAVNRSSRKEAPPATGEAGPAEDTDQVPSFTPFLLLVLLFHPRLGVVVWFTGWCFPAQSRGADGGIASTKPPLTPPAAWNGSRLQPLYAVGRTVPLARPKYRPLDRRRFAKSGSGCNSPGCMPAILPSDCLDPRHPTSWVWARSSHRLPVWMGGTPSIRGVDVGKPLIRKEGRYAIPPSSSLYLSTQCQRRDHPRDSPDHDFNSLSQCCICDFVPPPYT